MLMRKDLPKVIAGAYTNSSKGTKAATALYNIDATTGALVTQAPPNDGVLNTVDRSGMPVSCGLQHRRERRGQERRTARRGGALYSVDLKRGKAMMVGIVGLGGHCLGLLTDKPAMT